MEISSLFCFAIVQIKPRAVSPLLSALCEQAALLIGARYTLFCVSLHNEIHHHRHHGCNGRVNPLTHENASTSMVHRCCVRPKDPSASLASPI
ncbi:hypothetical protein BDD12DRAFT_214036 [Trichophaea hybrida]|nr:hypothetical protein BDD12DRAFT_214036 [Trichophaea hybrida]